MVSLPPSSTRALLTSFTEPIHILGAGAMGMLVASSIRCAFPSYPVKLLVRPDHSGGHRTSRSVCLRKSYLPKDVVTSSASVQANVQRKRSRENSPRVVHIPCETATGRGSNIRNLIVTTKAGSAIEALESVRHRLLWHDTYGATVPPCIIVLCNGALAVAEEGQQTMHETACPLHLGLVTHGVYKEASDTDTDTDLHHIVHAGNGTIRMQGSADIASLLDLSGLNCTLEEHHGSNMQWLLWQKLAANCIINPLTAIHQCLNGQIVHQSKFHEQYDGVLREITQVYTGLYYDAGNVTERIERDLRVSVDSVIRDTALNRSSMRQDVEAGRWTEIDYLSGYVVRMGAKVNVPTPVNQELWDAVRALTPLK